MVLDRATPAPSICSLARTNEKQRAACTGLDSLNGGQARVCAKVELHVFSLYLHVAPKPARQQPHRMPPSYKYLYSKAVTRE